MTTTSLPPRALDPTELPPPGRGRVQRILRGAPGEPVWARPALLVLLALTAAFYLWDLGQNGTSNDFYAAAVQAGTKSWKAMFFGSFDSSNFITVDKPPASLWVMEISARIFGFNTWSLLVPEVLEGVAAVGLLYAAVRRWSGHAAGLFAGAALALTPVAALMFRFDNPDALLVLLLVAGGYATVRALESASRRWLCLAGAALGFGFLTKELQAFLVLPAFVLAYLVAAPTSLWRRIGDLLTAGAALVVAAGWWVLAVSLTPAADRPYIGGSTTNSVLELAFGYNGLGRITGNESGAGGGGGGGAQFSGATGWTRLFATDMGAQASWLLPSALLALVAGLWLTRRAPRTDRTRAALILWGGWLLVTGIVFSFASGTIHTYYTIAFVPAVTALIGVTGAELWRTRQSWVSRVIAAAMVGLAAGWSVVLLDRDASWHPALRTAVIAGGSLAVIGILGFDLLRGRLASSLRPAAVKATAVGVLVLALLGGIGGAAAYSAQTVTVAHTGSIPTAGPASAGGFGGVGFGGRPGGRTGGFGGTRPSGTGGFNGTAPAGTRPSGTGGGTAPGSTGTGNGFGFGGGGTAAGGSATTTSTALSALLAKTTTRWSAATVGSQSAAPLELSSGTAIMALGGFTGSDPSLSLAQFQADVAKGEIHYFIGGGTGGGGGGNSTDSSAITSWVTAHFTATTVGGETVYDLTATPSS